MSTARLRQTTLPVSSPYGERVLKSTGRRNFHKGTDFPFSSTTPISSFGDGVVTFAGRRPKGHPDYERGIFVEVSHAPGIGTSYHSLSRTTVKEGDSVALGQTIGYGGKTAVAATGDHCHIGFWLDGKHRNLEDFLTPGVIVTVSNSGLVLDGSSKPFDNSAAPAASPVGAPPKTIDEDDMCTDTDRAVAAETLTLIREAVRLLGSQNNPVLVKTGRSNKVWLSDLMTRRLVVSEDELAVVKNSLKSRSLSQAVNVVGDLDHYGIPVLTDAQRKSLTQAQIDGDA